MTGQGTAPAAAVHGEQAARWQVRQLRREADLLAAVLDRDVSCRCQRPHRRGGHNQGCDRPAQVVVYHPVSRADLVARGLDPHDPARAIGLCVWCRQAMSRVCHPGLRIHRRRVRRPLGAPRTFRGPAHRMPGRANRGAGWWCRVPAPHAAPGRAAPSPPMAGTPRPDGVVAALHRVLLVLLLVLVVGSGVMG